MKKIICTFVLIQLMTMTAWSDTTQKFSTQTVNPTLKELDQIFDTMLDNLLGVYSNKKIDVLSDPDICHESAASRLNFVMAEVPYTNNLKFTKKCFFEGDFRNEFDKKLSADFKVKNIASYNRLGFDYTITRKVASGVITITTLLTNGRFSNLENKPIKFTSQVRLTITPQEVLLTAGRSGINVEKAFVDVQEYNGQSSRYHREF